MNRDDSLLDAHFKEQRQYLANRGINTDTITKLKLQMVQGTMLFNMGIQWAGVEKGVLWRIWDYNGEDTGAIGARVWYLKKGFADFSDKPKFATPKGQIPRLYHSPLSDFGKIQYGDTVVLCESYLKADILAMLGYKAIGVSGCWGWSHNKAMIEDFKKLPWKELGLKFVISFDSNVGPDGDPMLTKAITRLAAEMERVGVSSQVSYLPKDAEGNDWGIDDYYVDKGMDAVHSLFLPEYLEEIKTDLNQHLNIMNREVGVVRSIGKVIDINSGYFMSRDVFINMVYADRAVWSDDDKRISVPKAWLQWADKTSVERVVYRPGEPKINDDEYNMWSGMGCEPIMDDDWVKLWEEWLYEAIPDKRERDWFCSWWASQIQELGLKLNSCLVLIGKSGVGKGWLAAIMRRIYGFQNAVNVDLEALGSKFNAEFAMKQLIMVEEAEVPRGANTVYTKVKDLITNERIMYHQKGVTPFLVDNYANVMLQGNRVDIFKLDEFDRRFAVIDIVNDRIANNDKFWSLRWEGLKCGLPEAVYAWLLEYDTSNFDPHGEALKSDAKRSMVDVTRTPRERFVMELQQDPENTLLVCGISVDGYVATAKELEYIYQNGEVPMWDIDTRDSNNMAKALKLARIRLANNGKKIKNPLTKMPARYYMIRFNDEVDDWSELVASRQYWKKTQ